MSRPRPSAPASRAARRTGLVLAAVVALSAIGALVPAAADTPVGWEPEPELGFWHYALVFGVLPLAAFIVITVLVYAPSLARGEALKPGPQVVDDQWLGGPRKTAGELAGPDGEESKAGGASGRW